MPNSTPNMALQIAIDSDNAQSYLESSLGGSLSILDGHDHSQTTKGLPVGRIASGLDAGKGAVTPAAGAVYFATDTTRLYAGNGSAWEQMNPTVGGVTPANVGATADGSSSTAAAADHAHAMSSAGAYLGSDITGLTANTYVDAVSLGPLAAGTWWIVGQITLQPGSTTDEMGAKMYYGSTVLVAAEMNMPANGNGCTLPLIAGPVVLTGSTTVKIAGLDYNGSGSIKATTVVSNLGSATLITALRIA